jgi:dTDP-4-amino-4,6-dideoxygalactose transaminase
LNRPDVVLYEFSKNGIWRGISSLGLKPGDRVGAPSYICRSALKPLYDFGLDLVFFRINERLEPDRRDLEFRLASGARALLFVHYFGFPQDLDYFAYLRERYGVILIEDCAHAFLGERENVPLGSVGDVSIFCMRKFVPIMDGGAMLLKASPDGDARESPRRLKAAKGTLDLMISHAEFRTGMRLSRIRELLRMRRRVLPERRPADEKSSRIGGYDLTISGFSRYLLRRFDWDSIVARRRENYAYLLDLIADVPGLRPVFGGLADGTCPQVLPMLADNRDEVLASLGHRGIQAGRWPEPSDAVREVGCKDADFLHAHMLMLPVHQNLRRRHLERCAQRVRAAARPRGKKGAASFSTADSQA